jgi:hypothetical protein
MKNVAPARTLTDLASAHLLLQLGANYKLQLKILSRASNVDSADMMQTYFLIYFEWIDCYDPTIGPLANFLWSKLRIKILDMTYGVNRFPLQIDLSDQPNGNICEDIPAPTKQRWDEDDSPDLEKYPSLNKPWDYYQKHSGKSIEEIAEELGVTTRCVYQQFKRMQDIALKAYDLN